MKKMRAIILKADMPDKKGNVYSEKALKEMAKNNDNLYYDEQTKSLIAKEVFHRDLPPVPPPLVTKLKK